jgi:hypothetical protein
MKVITADIFLNHWFAFSNELTANVGWLKHWQSSTAWSNYILGTKRSSNDSSPIGEYFSKIFDKLRYRTEDGLYDLTMALGNNYKSIPTLDKNYQLTTFDSNEKDYYPAIYDVLLEHENQIYYSWHEVAKLAWVRGFLKVLVTYNSDNLDELQIRSENQMMIKTFTTIIQQSNTDFADNNQTEYLLLIGRQESNKLIWAHKIFDCNGKPR